MNTNEARGSQPLEDDLMVWESQPANRKRTNGARVCLKSDPCKRGTIRGGYIVGGWQCWDVDWDNAGMSACSANDLEILCSLPATDPREAGHKG